MNVMNLISSILMMVAPILITAAGGMVCERSGVVNIALDGLMQIGACAAATAYVLMESTLSFNPNATSAALYNLSPSFWLALLIGALFGMLFSAIHAFASISLKADQTISGTGINLLATGVTIFSSQIIFGKDRTDAFKLGFRSDALGMYPSVYVAIVVILVIWIVLYKLPFGLRLRACGEHPGAAASVGVKVIGIRYFAVLLSGFLAGLAGGCLVLTVSTEYNSNLINGLGFIALAAVAFGRWNPLGITLASLLFGAAKAFAVYVINIESLSKALPSEFFSLLPYVITILALIIFSGKNYAPVASGKPYEKGAS